MALRTLVFIIVVLLSLSTSNSQQRKRRHLQDIKTGIDDVVAPTSSSLGGGSGDRVAKGVDVELPEKSDKSNEKSRETFEDNDVGVKCPVPVDTIKFATESFWRNDLLNAFSCSAELMERSGGTDLAHSIVFTIGAMKRLPGKIVDPKLLRLIAHCKHASTPLANDAPVALTRWEVLSPIAVGKLEVDADPSFDSMRAGGEGGEDFDVGQYLLGMGRDTQVLSEIMPSGVVSWREVPSQHNGIVEVRSPIQWNELVQGVSTTSAYEFQGWARATTHVKSKGLYLLSCKGVHTMYVRNDNQTRLYAGDVYNSGTVKSLLELSAGPVGVLLPLRGVAVTSFSCSMSAATDPIHIAEAKHVPDLLELHPYVEGKGLLLCGVFSMSVRNTQAQEVSLTFRVEPPPGLSDTFSILKATKAAKQARGLAESMSNAEVVVAPGQTTAVPLEIQSYDDEAVYIPCRKGMKFTVTAIPSRGSPVKRSVEFPCRRLNESFLVSYVDHDSSVSQAAVLMPLKSFPDDTFIARGASKRASLLPTAGRLYPLILSLHGTGASASSQADAFKAMPARAKDYIFGVEDYWVVAPSRHGAHNWEAIGDLSARSGTAAVQRAMSKFPSLLPQVSPVGSVISGHSMGGHGAWVLSSNLPDAAVCVASAAGWTRKEDYGSSNDFFRLDVSNSYIDPALKLILEMAMSEFHVDKFVSNLQFLDVNVRVGASDLTTHPYYSRRMYRLLKLHGINATLEEVPGKQHWWWDTNKENDGGVLNDAGMRAFYSQCSAKSMDEVRRLTGNATGAQRCTSPFTLSLINTANQNGMCGVRIMQQFKIMSMSTIRVSCGGTPHIDKVCHVSTRNVKRAHLADVARGAVALIVDGLEIAGSEVSADGSSAGQSLFAPVAHICWGSLSEGGNGSPRLCTNMHINPMAEKVPDTNGPFRQLYAKPFLVVHGTPQSKELRTAMKDLAVYLANSHLSAHDTHVQVMSDQDYVSKKYAEFDDLYNVLFVGGPTLNRAMRRLCSYDGEAEGDRKVHCKSPVHFQTENSEKRLKFFKIGPHTFSKSSDAVIFTMPVTQYSEKAANDDRAGVLGQSALGACIHANTVNGFLHLSRLAWPVVPPMVRAPFGNYIPDFLVINSNVWQQGMAAVQLAGYWNSHWRYDREQAYAL